MANPVFCGLPPYPSAVIVWLYVAFFLLGSSALLAVRIAKDRALKARIGAARLLLLEHGSGSSHKAVSAIQMAAILDMVSTQKLTNIDKSAVC